MQAFDFVSAQSVDEVVSLLAEHPGQARLLSGGTDLLVALREGRLKTQLVIDVKGLPETKELTFDPQKGLRLGASVPCHRMYDDAAVAGAFPGLIDSASLIGGVQIQGRASLGGNLCNASPAADGIPSLIVHSAICNIAGPNGRRQVPVQEFCVAPGRNCLAEGEFLVSMDIPAPQSGFGAAYQRFIPRNEMDIAVVGVGASVVLDESRTQIKSARVALGAVAPRPLYVPEVGEYLAGKTISDEVIHEAGDMARAATSCISDMRGTADFRRHLSGVLTRRVLAQAIERAKAN